MIGLIFGIPKSTKTVSLTNYGYSSASHRFGTALLRAFLQSDRLVRTHLTLKHRTTMITLVFIAALLVFAYMLYVLIKPEKF